jgi:hypothetical protein
VKSFQKSWWEKMVSQEETQTGHVWMYIPDNGGAVCQHEVPKMNVHAVFFFRK